MRKASCATLFCLCLSAASAAAAAAGDVVRKAVPPECGDMYAPPFANSSDGGRRTCAAAEARLYQSKYNGIGKAALDIESRACFVPDESYRLLDQIVENVRARAAREGLSAATGDRRQLMERLSAITGDVLEEMGFGLLIPTHTLGDALHHRHAAGEGPRHTIDCDASSLILLEVAAS